MITADELQDITNFGAYRPSLEQVGTWITHSRKLGKTAILSRAELDRFFDNRDPAEWSCPILTGVSHA